MGTLETTPKHQVGSCPNKALFKVQPPTRLDDRSVMDPSQNQSGSLFVYIHRKQYTNGTLVTNVWRMAFFTLKLQLAPLKAPVLGNL